MPHDPSARTPGTQDAGGDSPLPLPGGPQWPHQRSRPLAGGAPGRDPGGPPPPPPQTQEAPAASTDEVLRSLRVRRPETADIPARVQNDLVRVHRVLETDQDIHGWASVDLLRFLNPAGAAAALRRAPLASTLNWFRPLLLFVAMVLTVLAALAVVRITRVLPLPPALAALVPNAFARPVSVALVVGAMLCLLVWLVMTVHRSRKRALRDREANDLEDDVRNVAVTAALDIATRTSMAAGMAEFLASSRNLTATLAAADRRIDELARRREQEMADLATFAAGFSVGADHLLRNAEVVERMYTWCAELAETLATQQQQVEKALRELQGELQRDRLAHETTSRDLASRVPLLSEATEKVSAAEQAMARNLELLAAEIKGLRKHAQRDDKDFEKSLATVTQAAEKLEMALRPLPAVARAMDEVRGQMLNAAEQMTAGASAVRSALIDVQKGAAPPGGATGGAGSGQHAS
jgi:hypothetical protein